MLIQAYHKRTRHAAGGFGIVFKAAKYSATATATGTDKQNFPGISGLYHQPRLFRLMENFNCLALGNFPTPLLPNASFRGLAKAQAALFGFVTPIANDAPFLPANAIIHG